MRIFIASAALFLATGALAVSLFGFSLTLAVVVLISIAVVTAWLRLVHQLRAHFGEQQVQITVAAPGTAEAQAVQQ